MKYVISQDQKSGAWYCHMEGFPLIPVFGSIGDKAKAKAYCNMRNGKSFNKALVEIKGEADGKI